MKRQYLAIILVTILFVFLYHFMNPSVLEEGEQIKRNERGGGSSTVSLVADIKGNNESVRIDLPIEAVQLTEKAANQKLKEVAERLIDEGRFLGKNKDADHVMWNLNLEQTAEEGQIKIDWSFDNFNVMDSEGKIMQEEVPTEGVLIKGIVALSYDACRLEKEFYIRVIPAIYTAEQDYQSSLKEALRLREESTRSEKYVSLPDEFKGKKISWKTPKDYSILMIPFFGVAALIFVYFGRQKAAQREEEKRKWIYLKKYPEIVSEFAVLLGAGMSLASAWEQISLHGEGGVYEEMRITVNEMKDGISEGKAYEKFGLRCNVPEYRKLSSLFVQNLRRGTGELTELMDREARASIEEHKNRIIKKGEEAGTKLLLPMMILLIIVLAIILIPALFQFHL
ncbi:MAG: type II secretion system F family protein [Lachnospiraceae bacterium]